MADSHANITPHERPLTRSITRLRQQQQQQQQQQPQQQQQLQQPKQEEDKQRSQEQEQSLSARSSRSSQGEDDHAVNTSAPEKPGIDETSSNLASKATNAGNRAEDHLDAIDDASNLFNQNNFNCSILSAEKHTYDTSGQQETKERGFDNNAYSCDSDSLALFDISGDAILHSSNTTAKTTALPDDYSQAADVDDKTTATRDDISADRDNTETAESVQQTQIIDQWTSINHQQTEITDQQEAIINQPTDDIMILSPSNLTSNQSQLGLDSFDAGRSIDRLWNSSADSVPLTDASSCTGILGQASYESIPRLQHQQQPIKTEGEEQQQQQPQLQQAEQQQQQQRQQNFQTHLKGILKQETNSTATLSSFATMSTSGETTQKPLTKSTLRKKLACINSELDDNYYSPTVVNRSVIRTESGHLVSDLRHDDVEANSRRTPITFVRFDDKSKKTSMADQADNHPLRKMDEPSCKPDDDDDDDDDCCDDNDDGGNCDKYDDVNGDSSDNYSSGDDNGADSDDDVDLPAFEKSNFEFSIAADHAKGFNFDFKINNGSPDGEDSDDDNDDASGENRSASRKETASEGMHNEDNQVVYNAASTVAQIFTMEGDDGNGNEDGDAFIKKDNSMNRDANTSTREAVSKRKRRASDEDSFDSDEPASKKARCGPAGIISSSPPTGSPGLEEVVVDLTGTGVVTKTAKDNEEKEQTNDKTQEHAQLMDDTEHNVLSNSQDLSFSEFESSRFLSNHSTTDKKSNDSTAFTIGLKRASQIDNVMSNDEDGSIKVKLAKLDCSTNDTLYPIGNKSKSDATDDVTNSYAIDTTDRPERHGESEKKTDTSDRVLTFSSRETSQTETISDFLEISGVVLTLQSYTSDTSYISAMIPQSDTTDTSDISRTIPKSDTADTSDICTALLQSDTIDTSDKPGAIPQSDTTGTYDKFQDPTQNDTDTGTPGTDQETNNLPNFNQTRLTQKEYFELMQDDNEYELNEQSFEDFDDVEDGWTSSVPPIHPTGPNYRILLSTSATRWYDLAKEPRPDSSESSSSTAGDELTSEEEGEDGDSEPEKDDVNDETDSNDQDQNMESSDVDSPGHPVYEDLSHITKSRLTQKEYFELMQDDNEYELNMQNFEDFDDVEGGWTSSLPPIHPTRANYRILLSTSARRWSDLAKEPRPDSSDRSSSTAGDELTSEEGEEEEEEDGDSEPEIDDANDETHNNDQDKNMESSKVDSPGNPVNEDLSHITKSHLSLTQHDTRKSDAMGTTNRLESHGELEQISDKPGTISQSDITGIYDKSQDADLTRNPSDSCPDTESYDSSNSTGGDKLASEEEGEDGDSEPEKDDINDERDINDHEEEAVKENSSTFGENLKTEDLVSTKSNDKLCLDGQLDVVTMRDINTDLVDASEVTDVDPSYKTGDVAVPAKAAAKEYRMVVPLQRKWYEVAGVATDEDSTVVSYNVIGRLAESERNLFQQELEGLQGDVICMQRISSDYFYRVLQPYMTQLGYHGEYLAYKDDTYHAGLATFVKLDRFELIGYSAKDLDSLLDKLDDTEEGIRSSVTVRTPAVLQVTDLTYRSSPNHRRLRVLNYELIDVDVNSPMSVIQVYAVMKEAMASGCAVIICSDLGVPPVSDIYYFLSEGCLHASYRAQWQHNAVFQRFEHLLHDYVPRFKSAYGQFSRRMRNIRSRSVAEPSGAVRSYSGYIWNSQDVEVTAVLKAPDELQTGGHPDLRHFTTRHIALAARISKT